MTIQSTLSVNELQNIIQQVTQAEKITKQGLSTLSRELLAHVYEHGDVSLINDLLGQGDDGKFRLTPINWRIAVQYFDHFVSFTSNYEKDVKKYATKGEGNRVPLVFNKKSKQKYQVKLPLVESWLAESANDIWSWSHNVEMEAKAPDYLKTVANDINKAMDEEKGNLSAMQVLAAIVDNTEIDLQTLTAFLQRPIDLEEQQVA